MPRSGLQRVESLAPKQELFVRERYAPVDENELRSRAKTEKVTGSITLEYSQGTVVAVTVQFKVNQI